MTILIVEDDADCLLMLAETLSACGINPIASLSLEGSLIAIPSADAILCDGLAGRWLEVFTLAAKHGKPFVLLSGDGRQIEAARNLGVRAYLKPHSIREILGELGCTGPAEPMADATGEP